MPASSCKHTAGAVWCATHTWWVANVDVALKPEMRPAKPPI
jgi:hypothetical protein